MTRIQSLHKYVFPFMTVIKLRKMRWSMHVTHMKELRRAYNIVGKPEGKRLIRAVRSG